MDVHKCGSTQLTQETDVLDTWFSSGLLPFTTLGWPEHTRDHEVFYPTSLLITAYEILFFWVARMIMFGCHFMPDKQDPAIKKASGWADRKDDSVPFREVYIHALVRDAERQKMSKTKGNVIDPLGVIDKYGTDATRFTLAAMASPGTDISFNEKRTEGYRAFANKIWNAARFIFMNVDRAEQAGVWSLAELTARLAASASGTGALTPGIAEFTPAAALEDRWILSRFNRVAEEVGAALQSHRFHDAANRVYDFFWGEFCDWYIELIKPRLSVENAPDPATHRNAFQNVVSVFEAALRLLHPFMPFITEEIWHAIYDGKPRVKSIALATYPASALEQIDAPAEHEMAILQELIVTVRNTRAELKIEPRQRVPIEIHAAGPIRALIEENATSVQRLATVDGVRFVETSLANLPGARTTPNFEVHVIYQRSADAATERDRLTKELERMEREIGNAQRQLGNESFLSKAPAHVVDGLRKRAQELETLRAKARGALAELQ